ncbi:MAG: hypothetical protein WCO86_15530, partial [Planctomycetota bacterium]
SDVLRLQQEADELEKAVAQQQTIVAEFRQQFTELEGTLQTAEANPDKTSIAGLQNQIAGLRSQQVLLRQRLDEQEQRLLAKQLQLKAVTEATVAAKEKLYAVNSAIIALRKQVEDAEQATASAGTETILEFTNTVGTTRTPIIVEVTKEGYQIQPTGIVIKSKDMQGFPVSDTPLMAAILAVHRERAKGSVTSQPYVLLLVRPTGSEAFYPAQGILANEKIHFGYELIQADKTIASGASAPLEIAAAEAAMAEAFRRREKIYANLRYLAQGVPSQGTEGSPDPSRRGLTIRPDGTVRSESHGADQRASSRNFAGGVAPPPGFYERRAAAMAAEAVAREESRRGSGTPESASPNFADQFAEHYAHNTRSGIADRVGGDEGGSHFSEVPANRSPQAQPQNSDPATDETLTPAEPTFGSDARTENMLFRNGGQPVIPKSASTASGGSDGEPPLTAEEEFASMMSGTPSSEPPSAAPRHFQLPSASGTATSQSPAGEPTNEVPGSPMLDLSRVDKDLLSRLPSTKKATKTYATPIGITVFLDEHHMTVAQHPTILVTPDSLNSAVSDLLRNIDTEVMDAKKSPREEVLPVVKFIVSPGGERWRIPLAGSLKHLGIPSASIYELSPHIETTAAPGKANY